MISLKLNRKEVSVDVPGDPPLLWVLRDQLNLTGTKFGCGIGACGACTVQVNGKAEYSCAHLFLRSRARTCSQSKDFLLTVGIHCSARGSLSRFHSVAIVNLGKSCEPQRC